jgi:hypothetical protein
MLNEVSGYWKISTANEICGGRRGSLSKTPAPRVGLEAERGAGDPGTKNPGRVGWKTLERSIRMP